MFHSGKLYKLMKSIYFFPVEGSSTMQWILGGGDKVLMFVNQSLSSPQDTSGPLYWHLTFLFPDGLLRHCVCSQREFKIVFMRLKWGR